MKIRPEGPGRSMRADGRMDRKTQTDRQTMMKLTVAFCNFEKAPEQFLPCTEVAGWCL
jgi:hypothetical protein